MRKPPKKEKPAPPKGPPELPKEVKMETSPQGAAKETDATPPEKKGLFSWFKRKKHDIEQETDDVVVKLQKKERRKRLKRKSLQEYIWKAGYSADAARVRKALFRAITASFFVSSVIIITLASLRGADAVSTLIFILGMWTALYAGVLLVGLGAIYFFLDYRIYRRTREVEDVLPDFLQLASANIAAGMPIDRALWYSIRPSFGVLAKEMEEVAKATMAGESLEESLVRFTEKYDSVMLKRSISILIEGLHSGGELADLLNKIALNIDEIKLMKKEMAANVTTYAIFIIVAAIVISPVLFALATQLLIIIVEITGSLDLTASSSLFTIGSVSDQVVDNFTTFSYLMLIVSSIFGASIVSVIQKGNVKEGIKGIPVYAIVAIVMYKVAGSFLGGVFGGIV